MLLEVSWTDTVQAIAAAIAVPGSIWALFILLKRDKDRESEIQSLSQIAQQLTNMLKVSESRHKDSKKPHLTIVLNDFHPYKMLRCEFMNTNLQTTIIDYLVKAESDQEINPVKAFVTSNHKEQSFHIELIYKGERPDWIVLSMEYETEEKFIFTQDILIWYYQKKEYIISPRAIVDKDYQD